VSELFYGIAVLACPVGMGAMMWFMMRGGRSQPQPQTDSAAELTRMRAEIDQLRAGHRDSSQRDTNVTYR